MCRIISAHPGGHGQNLATMSNVNNANRERPQGDGSHLTITLLERNR